MLVLAVSAWAQIAVDVYIAMTGSTVGTAITPTLEAPISVSCVVPLEWALAHVCEAPDCSPMSKPFFSHNGRRWNLKAVTGSRRLFGYIDNRRQ